MERAERTERNEKEHASKHVDIESKRFFYISFKGGIMAYDWLF